jgi:hypothetical protein
MRGRVLDQRDLQGRAEDLRRSFADEKDMAICTCMLADEVGQLPPKSMDARERKWTAAKLLRPVDAETATDLEGFSEEEILMVHERYWAITVSRAEEEPVPVRHRRLASQLAQTKVFACAAWGIAAKSDLVGKLRNDD